MAGAALPLAKLTEFWIFENEFSIFSLSSTLVSSRESLLAGIVSGFGFLFPPANVATNFSEGAGSIPAPLPDDNPASTLGKNKEPLR